MTEWKVQRVTMLHEKLMIYDNYSTVDKCPDDEEMPYMVGKVLNETLKDMGFKEIEVQIDDYEPIDWDEKLYDELRNSDYEYGD